MTGAIALVSLLALGACASTASAQTLSMTFTEARANVGVQLSDAALFEPPATARFAAQIDPGSGSIAAGQLQVPQFATHITEPLDADVTVDFEIGVITGSFNQATGALILEGEAGGTLTSKGSHCTVSTSPPVLVVSTAGNSGGKSPRSGAPFAAGLTGPGAIAGQWTDMNAEPVTMEDKTVCEVVDERIGGPGGVWLQQKGDLVPPSAPLLTGTRPASPASSGTPRIRGSAEAGSSVRIYSGSHCAGMPVATGTAVQLSSPGIRVNVAAGVTATFSATATDAAGNTSACSARIAYKRLHSCVVPRLKGKSLRRAREALEAAHCRLGNVHRPGRKKGESHGPLVVKSSTPPAGKRLDAGSAINLKLGPRPRKARR